MYIFLLFKRVATIPFSTIIISNDLVFTTNHLISWYGLLFKLFTTADQLYFAEIILTNLIWSLSKGLPQFFSINNFLFDKDWMPFTIWIIFSRPFDNPFLFLIQFVGLDYIEMWTLNVLQGCESFWHRIDDTLMLITSSCLYLTSSQKLWNSRGSTCF